MKIRGIYLVIVVLFEFFASLGSGAAIDSQISSRKTWWGYFKSFLWKEEPFLGDEVSNTDTDDFLKSVRDEMVLCFQSGDQHSLVEIQSFVNRIRQDYNPDDLMAFLRETKAARIREAEDHFIAMFGFYALLTPKLRELMEQVTAYREQGDVGWVDDKDYQRRILSYHPSCNR